VTVVLKETNDILGVSGTDIVLGMYERKWCKGGNVGCDHRNYGQSVSIYSWHVPFVPTHMKGQHEAQGRTITCQKPRSFHGLLLLIGREGDGLGWSLKG
jgi:hypothetical protein